MVYTPKGFFCEPSNNSQIKQMVVASAFKLWLYDNRREKELSYIDLFSGPGLYDDGSFSTPLHILQEICVSELCAKKFNVVLNDAKNAFMARLRRAVDGIRNSKYLHSLTTSCTEIDGNVFEKFPNIWDGNSFAFVDAWGWKSLKQNYVRQLLENPKCEMAVFMNFNEMQRFISDERFTKLFIDLFGKSALRKLRKQCLKIGSNEELILKTFIDGITSKIANCHIVPFRFRRPDFKMTSHYVFIIVRDKNRAERLGGVLRQFSTCKTELLCYSQKCKLSTCACSNIAL